MTPAVADALFVAAVLALLASGVAAWLGRRR